MVASGPGVVAVQVVNGKNLVSLSKRVVCWQIECEVQKKKEVKDGSKIIFAHSSGQMMSLNEMGKMETVIWRRTY